MGNELAVFPNDWDVKPLIECTSVNNISYGVVQPGKHDSNGVKIIRVNNFEGGSLNVDDVLSVSTSVEAKHAKTRLIGGEVLLTLVGSTGQSVVVPRSLKGWNVARAVAVIRPSEKVSANWINICLQAPHTKHFLDSRANTTVQKTLNLKDVKEIPVPLPPLAERKKIESLITTMTDKIVVNRQINQTLEQMAQTLFKSWFVDFDPVIDNALDAGNPIPEVFETRVERRKAVRESAEFKPLPDDVRQLFPSEFEESELGWVPKGWAKGSLAEQISLIGGGTPKRSNNEFWGGQIPWFSVKDAPSSSDVFVIDTDEKITELGLNGSSTKLLPLGTTIISARGTVGKLALVGCEMAMNQSCYGVQPKDQQSFSFNYFNLKHAIKTLQQNTHGAVFDTITKNTFDTVEAVIPPQKVLDVFESYSTVWLEKIKSNLTTSASLTKLRDTLLPKLISGELRLDSPEVEQAKALVD